MVSTDDYEIADVAKKYGAEVPFMRTSKNSDDFATTADVLVEVIDEYKKLGKEFEYLCCIYPAAPFVTPDKLKDSYNLMIEKKADSIIPVVKFSYPIQRAFRVSNNGRLEYIWPENIDKRSQDLESAYYDAGQFYWNKTNSFLKRKNLVTNNTLSFIVSELEVQDIDNEEDWKIAELKFKI